MAHEDHDNLVWSQRMAESMVMPGGRYEHFKGGSYILSRVGIWEPTREPMVIYTSTDQNGLIFGRPFDAFTDFVSVNGTETPRFKFIERSGGLQGLSSE